MNTNSKQSYKYQKSFILTQICDAARNSLDRKARIVQFGPLVEQIFTQLSVKDWITNYKNKLRRKKTRIRKHEAETDMTRGDMSGKEREVSTVRGDDWKSARPLSRASTATSISFQILFTAPIYFSFLIHTFLAYVSHKNSKSRYLRGPAKPGTSLFFVVTISEWMGNIYILFPVHFTFYYSHITFFHTFVYGFSIVTIN